MAKYKEITAQTRQNLMDAFWKLYCERSIEKITVREITDKAGYHRSTFYEYFQDIYDVLDQIEQSLLPPFVELPPILLNETEASIQWDSFVAFYSTTSKYYTVLLGDNGDPAFAGKMKKQIKAKLMEQLHIAGHDVWKMDYSLEYILSAMIGVLTYWFQNGENIAQEKLLGLMHELTNSEIIKRLAKNLLR